MCKCQGMKLKMHRFRLLCSSTVVSTMSCCRLRLKEEAMTGLEVGYRGLQLVIVRWHTPDGRGSSTLA